MWWCVSTRYFTGLLRYLARTAESVQFDCQSETGASNTTSESFISTTRLLCEPPTTCWMPGPSSTSRRLPVRGRRAVDPELGDPGVDHGAPVQLVLERARDLHALDRLPVAQHEVVVHVAPDVVVVQRPDPR